MRQTLFQDVGGYMRMLMIITLILFQTIGKFGLFISVNGIFSHLYPIIYKSESLFIITYLPFFLVLGKYDVHLYIALLSSFCYGRACSWIVGCISDLSSMC